MHHRPKQARTTHWPKERGLSLHRIYLFSVFYLVSKCVDMLIALKQTVLKGGLTNTCYFRSTKEILWLVFL